ncbi:hypothetical protein ABVT39_005421, partial [Epinephelus coioides]
MWSSAAVRAMTQSLTVAVQSHLTSNNNKDDKMLFGRVIEPCALRCSLYRFTLPCMPACCSSPWITHVLESLQMNFRGEVPIIPPGMGVCKGSVNGKTDTQMQTVTPQCSGCQNHPWSCDLIG